MPSHGTPFFNRRDVGQYQQVLEMVTHALPGALEGLNLTHMIKGLRNRTEDLGRGMRSAILELVVAGQYLPDGVQVEPGVLLDDYDDLVSKLSTDSHTKFLLALRGEKLRKVVEQSVVKERLPITLTMDGVQFVVASVNDYLRLQETLEKELGTLLPA